MILDIGIGDINSRHVNVNMSEEDFKYELDEFEL